MAFLARKAAIVAWAVRLLVYVPVILWLIYLNWAGPKYDGRRVKSWIALGLELCAGGQYSEKEFEDITHVIRGLSPSAADDLLKKAPRMSDSDVPSIFMRAASLLPARLKERMRFRTAAQEKAALIILASELKPTPELARPIFLATLKSKSRVVRHAAAGGLIKLGNNEALALESLRSSDSEERQLGWGILWRSEMDLRPFLPELKRLTEIGGGEAQTAAWMLPRAAPDSLPFIETIITGTNVALKRRMMISMIQSARSDRPVRFPAHFAPFIAQACTSNGVALYDQHQFDAIGALGALESCTPELKEIAADAYAFHDVGRALKASDALRLCKASPEDICEVLQQAFEQVHTTNVVAIFKPLEQFIYGSPAGVPRRKPVALHLATNAVALAHTIIQRLETQNLRRFPKALPLIGKLAPHDPFVHSYLATMTRARDAKVVTGALWGLARTSYGRQEKVAVARALLPDPPPQPFFYFVRSIQPRDEALVELIRSASNSSHVTQAFRAESDRWLSESGATNVWNEKIPTVINGRRRVLPPEMVPKI